MVTQSIKMSLVAYDSSSESENETALKTKKVIIASIEQYESDDECETNTTIKKKSPLLALLPPPKQTTKPPEQLLSHRNKKQKIVATNTQCTSGMNMKKSCDDLLKQKTTTNVVVIKAITESSATEKTIKPVNKTCKRKHHITYLAQQAIVNEERFGEEWSQCKYKRQLSRLKYGF